jgi:predicted nucleic acid-binding protein
MAQPERASYIIDASVALKWFYREKESEVEQAFKLREDYRRRRVDLYAPDLLVYELSNVLRYKQDLEESYIEDAIDSIYEMRMLKPATQETLRQAIRIALQYNASVYDAVYLAFAEEHRTWLITADRQFYLKVKQIPLVIFVTEYGGV